jgi:carboxymethylenebutenolidase
MCDEFTAQADDAAHGLSRRDFAAVGGAALLAGCANGAGVGSAASDLAERTVSIETGQGVADGFFVHPVKGRHPGVIVWPDIGGLRDAFKVMARRLAGEGYAVLAVNQYYRSAPAPVLTSFAEWRTPEGRAKLTPMTALLNPQTVTTDARAFAAFLDSDPAVDKRRRIGVQGYCQGGPFAVRSAVAVPARIGAAASFHGAGLVTEAADSPHRLLPSTKASYLIAIAQNDDARTPTDKDTFRAAAEAAKRPAEVEVYKGDHGWCVPDAPSYNQPEADRAWARLLALYGNL